MIVWVCDFVSSLVACSCAYRERLRERERDRESRERDRERLRERERRPRDRERERDRERPSSVMVTLTLRPLISWPSNLRLAACKSSELVKHTSPRFLPKKLMGAELKSPLPSPPFP